MAAAHAQPPAHPAAIEVFVASGPLHHHGANLDNPCMAAELHHGMLDGCALSWHDGQNSPALPTAQIPVQIFYAGHTFHPALNRLEPVYETFKDGCRLGEFFAAAFSQLSPTAYGQATPAGLAKA